MILILVFNTRQRLTYTQRSGSCCEWSGLYALGSYDLKAGIMNSAQKVRVASTLQTWVSSLGLHSVSIHTVTHISSTRIKGVFQRKNADPRKRSATASGRPQD